MKKAKIKTVFAICGLLLTGYGNVASASTITVMPTQANQDESLSTASVINQPSEWQMTLLGVVLLGIKLTRKGKNQNAIMRS